MTGENRTANEMAAERTGLASLRTGLAADRTLMGWVRTGMSMITFGFTVYKLLSEAQERGMVLPRETTPRNVGLFLIAAGTFATIMGKIEYAHTLRQLGATYPFKLYRPSFIMALVISLSGLVLFLGIVSQLI